MSTILTTERLLKRACLVNLFMPEGIAITPLLSGTHGLGKSAICRQVAKDMGGEALTVEGGSLKEGEITGLPFAQTNPDGSKEVRFVPYYLTGRIQQLEKEIYNKAKEGFLWDKDHKNPGVILNEDGTTSFSDSEGEHTIPARNVFANIINGTDNQYEFGSCLTPEVKLQLLKSGEIMPIVLFIDEMNRTDSQTMKELMNIVLTRTVNGYKFPWWVFIVSAINPCGQDSIYSTNEMDAAQLDRFLKIKVTGDILEWQNYAIDKELNSDYIIALSTCEEYFQQKGKGYEESSVDDNETYTPRSHEICSFIYGSKNAVSNSGFFNNEEKMQADEDVRQLIIGKLGSRAGRGILSALKNRENFIDPKELIDGKNKTVDEKLIARVQKMKPIAQTILSKNIIKYFAKDAVKYFYDQSSKDPKVAEAAKKTWGNMISQIKCVLNILTGATQLLFAKNAYATKVELKGDSYEKYNGKESLFKSLGCTFSAEIVQQISMTSNITNSGAIDAK